MVSTEPPARRVGRPARISRQKIGDAAIEIGLTDLTLRAVAECLGVTIASLYHHIDGKEDLLRLAAAQRARQARLPTDRGQHWAVWLLEWAIYNRDAFATEPALLQQYIDSSISAEAIAENADRILAPLVRQGFTITEAQSAYEVVSSCAIGAAVHALRDERAAAEGRSGLHDDVLAERPADELPHLRQLVAETAADPPDDPLVPRVRTVLAGIAAERDEPWAPVAEALSAAAE